MRPPNTNIWPTFTRARPRAGASWSALSSNLRKTQIPLDGVVRPRSATTRAIRTETSAAKTNFEVVWLPADGDAPEGTRRYCLGMSTAKRACDPTASVCCDTSSPTPRVGVAKVQLFLPSECAAGSSSLKKALKGYTWRVGGRKTRAVIDAAAKAVLLSRAWYGETEVCVDMPDSAVGPCKSLAALCGPTGCRVTAVTTRFKQASAAYPHKQRCKMDYTLAGAQAFHTRVCGTRACAACLLRQRWIAQVPAGVCGPQGDVP
jgi:hypothetical protein